MTAAPARQPSPRAGRLLVAIVFAAIWGLITHGTFAGSGDEPHYLIIAHSFAFDRDLDLANNYRDATLVGGGALQPEAHALWRGDRLHPVHDIGMPLVFAPFVRIAYSVADGAADVVPAQVLSAARLNEPLILRHQMSLAMALLAALLAREIFLLLQVPFGATRRQAFAWALLFALSPPVLSHGFLFFTEVPTALVTMVVFRRLIGGPVEGRGVPAWWLVSLLGALTGFLVLVHARNVGLVVGLTLVATAHFRRHGARAAAVAFVAGLAVAGALRMWTTWMLWGTLITTPHAALGTLSGAGRMAFEVFTRGTGLLFDREFGLLAYAPVYLLAVPGLVLVARVRTPPSRAVLLVLACYLIPVLLPLTNVHGWTGGWTPAARFLVPVAPLLWVGVSVYGTRATGWPQAMVAALVLVQVAIDAYLWQAPMALWNDGDGVSAFAWTGWLPTWTDSGSAGLFAAALAAALVFGYLALREMPRPAPYEGTRW